MKTIAQQLNVTEFPFRIKDNNCNQIYFEGSNEYWAKSEYDSDGNRIYYENSDGDIIDKRPKIEEGFTVTHFGGLEDTIILNGIKYRRIEQKSNATD